MNINISSNIKSRCPYCGNNQVNHTFHYFSQSLWVKQSDGIGHTASRLHVLNAKLEEKGIPLLFLFLQGIGLVRFKTTAVPLNDRSKVIWDEARKRGFHIEQAFFLEKPTEEYRVRRHGAWHYFMSIPIPSDKGRTLSKKIDSKFHLKEFFISQRVQVPQGGRAVSIQEAIAIFVKVAKPVIVKPEVGSRGRHTVTNIYTLEQLQDAFKIAQTLCRYVVVEEHLVGSVYRATYVNGKIYGVLRGDPPRITGDGFSTIETLIQKKNNSKHALQKDFKINASSSAFLARQGYTLESVPDLGKTIDLSEKVGVSYGGFTAEDLPKTHPKLLEALTRAGDVLGIPLIGFDFISEDITKDPDTVRWGIIEGNTLPFIDLHHFPLEGEPINVAEKVWDMWETIK